MKKRDIHLVCNAHLDPVWLWEWEEGAGETLSTFRTAAGFCETEKGFVFCHNEAVLYRWVEEFEPALFDRIRRLVRRGRWHIMGGWHLQPDCNLPSGESFVRQILLGKTYFADRFGVDVKTACNLDPFGHTRGLVQILAKSGFQAYLFCRPGKDELPLESDTFVWVGYDGSEVLAERASAHYNSERGRAAAKIEAWTAAHPDRKLSLLLWGVGNHGGGASRRDLTEIKKLIKRKIGRTIRHSTPEAYFREVEKDRAALPRFEKDLNPWAVGCYTSMAAVKRKHRLLENELFATEKIVSPAWAQGLIPYPETELKAASEDLAFAQFHDLLPGSSIPAGEEGCLRIMDHGLEILSRVRARAFFALCSGQKPARRDEIPIFVLNPHPFRIRTIVECEFEPHEPDFEPGYLAPVVSGRGGKIPSQTEREESNLSVEWRKKAVFAAVLEPARLNRFSCRLERLPERPKPRVKARNGLFSFRNAEMHIAVGARSGLIEKWTVRGRNLIAGKAFQALVMHDNLDSWGMKVRRFRDVEGRFELLSKKEARVFAGVSGKAPFPAVRVIEDGPVRTVVEALFGRGCSRLVVRYKIPREGTEFEAEVRVFWAEKDRMLKLSLPFVLSRSFFAGQVAYGWDRLPSDGDEAVFQKWAAVISENDDWAATVINDGIYGGDFRGGELRLSLLRSPAYAADPMPGKNPAADDRHTPRQDQGTRIFRFWLNAGPLRERLDVVDREALVRNEKPFVLSYFPPGTGRRPLLGPVLSDDVVQIAALKKAEDGRKLVIRLFEPTGRPRKTTLSLPFAGAKTRLRLNGFEIKTLLFDMKTKIFREADLLENPLGDAPKE